MKKQNKHLSPKDYEFMQSLSAAMLEITPKRIRLVLFFWLIAVFSFILWAYFAQIDEIVRGDGEVIPMGQNQLIQNLEGGIVEEILVSEGEHVEKDQVLVKITNQKSVSSYSSNEFKAKALEVKIARLSAEAKGESFTVDPKLKKEIPELVENEKHLYQVNQDQFESKMQVLKEQLNQKKEELVEARMHHKHLQSSLGMVQQEVKMTEPMVAKGVRSKVDFLKLQREQNEIEERYNATISTISRLQSAIKEIQNKIDEAKFDYQSEARTKLSEAVADLKKFQASSTVLQDEMERTLIRSPLKGIVQTLYVHTVGGVIKPGEDIVEVVPSDQTLLIEVKVKPSDIAFIYYGQKAITKFSAYDFSIYGGLEGKVVHISADTTADDEGRRFYTLRIKTDKNYLGDEKKPLHLLPGMVADVDIITGKKSVLDYILKPILKTKQYTFTER